nr:MAG TPA: hypothetical protein [Caudoviricetes sp.]
MFRKDSMEFALTVTISVSRLLRIRERCIRSSNAA